MVQEEAILSFVQRSIKTGWSLELLLLLSREPERAWTGEALVLELRGTRMVVEESVAVLVAAGLIAVTDGRVSYRPQSAELARLAAGLADLYARKPLTIMRTIFTAPGDRIRSFADAFLFQKKPPSC